MKKILALALAMLLVLCLAACGGSAEEAAAPEVAVEEVVSAPAEAPAEAPEAPVEEALPADASGEMGASGEMPSGEMGGMGNQSADYEIELNGETVTAHYEDVDNGDTATKSFVITVNDQTIEGAIDKGVWTATSGDAADQAIVDAVKTVFESGNPASAEPAA